MEVVTGMLLLQEKKKTHSLFFSSIFEYLYLESDMKDTSINSSTKNAENAFIDFLLDFNSIQRRLNT